MNHIKLMKIGVRIRRAHLTSLMQTFWTSSLEGWHWIKEWVQAWAQGGPYLMAPLREIYGKYGSKVIVKIVVLDMFYGYSMPSPSRKMNWVILKRFGTMSEITIFGHLRDVDFGNLGVIEFLDGSSLPPGGSATA